MVALDELDRKILSILQENARTPFSEIARRLGVSEGTIHLRVRRLKEEGVIKGFYAHVSPEAVGKGLTAIICIRADPSKYASVLEKLASINEVYELYDVTGEFYAVSKIRTTDVSQLARVLDQVGSIDGVVSTQTMIVLRTIKEKHSIDI